MFSVSGGPLNSLYNATVDAGLRLIHTRHEAAAGFMADATARLTGIPGVCAVTLGPGVTNAITPAITARLASVPLLIIGGQVATRDLDRGAGMSIDPLPVMAPVTKWAARVLHTEQIPEYVERAWNRMLEGRPGPVFLEIPVDILGGSAAGAQWPPAMAASPPNPPGSDPAELDAARAALGAARRPLLIVGDDAFRDGAGDAVRELVDATGVPFYLARLARGLVSERHPACGGVAYVPANPSLRRALAEADCVILLGHFFEFDLEFGRGTNEAATIVQVSRDPSRLNENRRADVALVSGTRSFLEACDPASTMDIDRAWASSMVALWSAERESQTRAVGTTRRLHPVALVDAVVAAAPEDTVYVSSHGNVDFWVDARLQLDRPGHYLRAGQSGALGTEIPFGIGARIAHPERPVIVFVGDGGFGYHGFELDTAARYDAPIVVVVGDDRKWGAIAEPQRRRYGREVEMDLVERDLPAVARALGGVGFRAETAPEVSEAVRAAIESGVPAVVHVPIELVESPYMHYISSPH